MFSLLILKYEVHLHLVLILKTDLHPLKGFREPREGEVC